MIWRRKAAQFIGGLSPWRRAHLLAEAPGGYHMMECSCTWCCHGQRESNLKYIALVSVFGDMAWTRGSYATVNFCKVAIVNSTGVASLWAKRGEWMGSIFQRFLYDVGVNPLLWWISHWPVRILAHAHQKKHPMVQPCSIGCCAQGMIVVGGGAQLGVPVQGFAPRPPATWHSYSPSILLTD